MCASRDVCCLSPLVCDLSSGEVLGCLESCQGLNTIDLGDLCVTLDIFVLTLPLEIEVVNTDILHNRSVERGPVTHPLPALAIQSFLAHLHVLRLTILLLTEPVTALRKLKYFLDRLTFPRDPFSALCLFILSGSSAQAALSALTDAPRRAACPSRALQGSRPLSARTRISCTTWNGSHPLEMRGMALQG